MSTLNNTTSSPSGSKSQRANIGSGTNSPPLENTGSGKPMGMADVDGKVDAGHVSDREQRKTYFTDDKEDNEHGSQKPQGAGKEMKGQSMADEMDGRT